MIPGAAIGLVVKTHPKISETFILEELGLERQGLQLHIFSLGQPQGRCFSRREPHRAGTGYLPALGWRVERNARRQSTCSRARRACA